MERSTVRYYQVLKGDDLIRREYISSGDRYRSGPWKDLARSIEALWESRIISLNWEDITLLLEG